MPPRHLIQVFALAFIATACAAIPPPMSSVSPQDSSVEASEETSNSAHPLTPLRPKLAAFVGTWQQGEPCTNFYRWMDLREKDGVLEGQWAASMDIWGLMAGGLRATPDGEYLRTEVCLETYDLPRYAAFFAECPAFAQQSDERGLRLDDATGELLLISAPEGRVISRMSKADAASEPPTFCAAVGD